MYTNTFSQIVSKSIYCGTLSPNKKWEEELDKKKRLFEITKNKRTATEYTIPVIVHIIHNETNVGVNENLSESRIISQINTLNNDFGATNSDITNTPSYFLPYLAGDSGIRFCRATNDENGNILTEPGINRINWETLGWNNPSSYPNTPQGNYDFKENFNSFIKPNTIWDPTKYLNIWISDCSNILGFAYFPAGIAEYNNQFGSLSIESITQNYKRTGVVVYASVFGDNPITTSHSKGRTTTHEVGHWLGLRHIFGDAECGDDYCEDTPYQLGGYNSSPIAGANFGCPPNPWQINGCGAGSSPNGEMFMNYMDYTDDTCKFMFTLDQKLRMQTCMEYGTYRNPLQYSIACCPLADLKIINQSISPTTQISGDSITTHFAIDNNGILAASPNYVNYYLSSNDILTINANGDILLGQYFYNNTILPQSQTILLHDTIVIPSGLSTGTYYLFFAADGSNIIEECIENNNYATSLISISDPPPTSTQIGYRYWFNNNFNNLININLASGNTHYNIQSNISTTSLNGGLHTYNFQFKDGNNKWSSIASSFFYKNSSTFPAGSARYQYWYDNSLALGSTQTISSTNNLIVLNNFSTSSISHGLHTFNIRFKPDGKHWSSVNSSFFYKPKILPSGPPSYEYWLDQNYANKTSINNTTTSNFILLDSINYDTVSAGLHTFNIRFRPDGKAWSSVTSNFFYKPNELPSGNHEYEYWLDQNYNAKTTIGHAPTNNLIVLDSIDYDTLQEGLHTFNIRFRPDGKTWSSITSNFFYKLKSTPTGQPKYQYWFDNQIQDSITINTTSSLDFILLGAINGLPLSEGLHTFNIRFKPTGGQWSAVNTSFFVRGKTTIGTEISKCVYWFDDNYPAHNTIYYSGSANVFDIIYASTPGLINGEHTLSMFFMDNGGLWSSIVKDTFVKDTILPVQCPNNQVFTSGLGNQYNTAYQWQVNNGSGFTNLVNDTHHTGVNTDTLHITDPSPTWYGYTYRCIVTPPNGSNIYSQHYLLKFIYIWTGAIDTDWENPENWNCNGIPIENSDVIINSGTVNVNSNPTIGSITLGAGVVFNLNEGKVFMATGH
ncbi:MAG: hypothetical protein IPN29_17475 [Saprospiraceae bacterium]|nr:hypothetical protein [Saprospiraceae bacterium]